MAKNQRKRSPPKPKPATTSRATPSRPARATNDMPRARVALALFTVGFAIDTFLAVKTTLGEGGQTRGVDVIVLGIGAGAAILAGIALLFRAARNEPTRPLLLIAMVPVLAQMVEWFFLFRGGFDAGLLLGALFALVVADRILPDGTPVAIGSAAGGVTAFVALAQAALLLRAPDAKQFLMRPIRIAPSEILSALALVVLFATARKRAGAPPKAEAPAPEIDPATSPLSLVVVVLMLRVAVTAVYAGVVAGNIAELAAAKRVLPPAEAVLGIALAATMVRFARRARSPLAWIGVGGVVLGSFGGIWAAQIASEVADAKSFDAMQALLSKSAWVSAGGSVLVLMAFTFFSGAITGVAKAKHAPLAEAARGTATLFGVVAPLPIVGAIAMTTTSSHPLLRVVLGGVGPGVAGLLVGAYVALLRVLLSGARIIDDGAK